MKREDNNIYQRLSDGSYEPIGVFRQSDTIHDGIYYIRHHEYGQSTTSVKYLEGMFRLGTSKELSLDITCGLQDIVDKIEASDEYKKLLRGSYCIQDVIRLCVAKMYDLYGQTKTGDNE